VPARGTKAVQAYRGWVATMRRAARSLREMGSQKRRHDNGSCYLSKAFARACKQLGVKHIKIKPYAPQTNGKAERSFRPRLREWAYATAFEHSEQRRQALLPGSIATTSIGPMLASPKSHPAQHHSPDS